MPVPWGKDVKEVDEKWKKFLNAKGKEKEILRKEMGDEGYHRLITRPHYYIWLTVRRAIRLWNHGNLLYYYEEPRWVWAIFTVLTFLYYIFAILGVWVTRRSWRILYPIYVPFIYQTILSAPSHAEARYSIEMFPLVCIFGGVGLNYLKQWIYNRSNNRNDSGVK